MLGTYAPADVWSWPLSIGIALYLYIWGFPALIGQFAKYQQHQARRSMENKHPGSGR
jgi:hypothetical protein